MRMKKNSQYQPVAALDIPAIKGATAYPSPFNMKVKGRSKHKLGEAFGLTHFGVNLTELEPGSISSLAHHHSQQDEFIYVVEGELTLKLNQDTYTLKAGDCMGFRHGTGIAHQLINQSQSIARYLEIGDRNADDEVVYPYDPIQARLDKSKGWIFTSQ
jgi:uncharacterized cupin superfamily protein